MEKYIRKLAKSINYQTLYARAKELNGFYLFENKYNFTHIQIIFLQWLQAYEVLYTDISMNEEYIDEEVIKDDIRTEAYLLYRKYKNSRKDSNKNKPIRDNLSGIPSMIFKES